MTREGTEPIDPHARIEGIALMIGAKEEEPGVWRHGITLFDTDAYVLDILEELCETTHDCRDCEAPMWFLRSKRGRLVPYNADGSTHFETCPYAAKYRKKRRGKR